MDLVREMDLGPVQKGELEEMLELPSFLARTFMFRAPLIPIRKSHSTQIFFVFLLSLLFFSQLFIIIPGKYYPPFLTLFLAQRFPWMAYAIIASAFFLAVFFSIAS